MNNKLVIWAVRIGGSLTGGVVCFYAWMYSLLLGTGVYYLIVNVISSSQSFSRSRGSMLDVMAWNHAMANPLRGVRIGEDTLTTFFVVSLLIGFGVFISGVMKKTVKHSIGMNLQSVSGSLGLTVLLYCILLVFSDSKNTSVGTIFFVGTGFVLFMGFIGNFLLKQTEVTAVSKSET